MHFLCFLYGAKTPVYVFVPLYVPVALPVGMAIPQYMRVLTAVVLVGEVRRKPETLEDASLNSCSPVLYVNEEVA